MLAWAATPLVLIMNCSNPFSLTTMSNAVASVTTIAAAFVVLGLLAPQEHRRAAALHVAGAPAVQEAFDDLAVLVRPAISMWDGVEMAREHDALLLVSYYDRRVL